MSMVDTYSKEEADKSFVKESDLASQMCGLLKDDENVKKEIRKSIYRDKVVWIVLLSFVAGLFIGDAGFVDILGTAENVTGVRVQ